MSVEERFEQKLNDPLYAAQSARSWRRHALALKRENDDWIAYADKLEAALELVRGQAKDQLTKMHAEQGLRIVRPTRIDVALKVDGFVALGMLKLDEPKSAKERFCDAIYPIRSEDRHVEFLLDAIDRAGLKIVSK